jgi:hypothetical protein
MNKMHFSEVVMAAKRLEGVVLYKYTPSEDPWLLLKIDGKLMAVPLAIDTKSKLIDFVCRIRAQRTIISSDDTQPRCMIGSL